MCSIIKKNTWANMTDLEYLDANQLFFNISNQINSATFVHQMGDTSPIW